MLSLASRRLFCATQQSVRTQNRHPLFRQHNRREAWRCGTLEEHSNITLSREMLISGFDRKSTSVLVDSRRYLSSGAAKPTWVVPRDQRFGPTIPDTAYYGEHATYNYFVLFLRGLRPYLEKIFGDCWSTFKSGAKNFGQFVVFYVVKHNPELRLQVVALLSFTAMHALLTQFFNKTYQHLVDVTSLLELQIAEKHAAEGFWMSPSEQQEKGLQLHAEQHLKYLQRWDQALQGATEARNFDVLVRHLGDEEGDPEVDGRAEREQCSASMRSNTTRNMKSYHTSQALETYPASQWNFSLMPYGKDNPDTHTITIPDHEQPFRAFSLSFTSNNLSGNWGDYVDRQDNKNAIMRPARTMFTDAYIPPTK